MRYEEAEVGVPADNVRRITDHSGGGGDVLNVAASLGLTPATEASRRVWTRTSGALVACDSMSIETSEPEDVLVAPAFLTEAWPEWDVGRVVARGDRLALLLFSRDVSGGPGAGFDTEDPVP